MESLMALGASRPSRFGARIAEYLTDKLVINVFVPLK
jgi:hypothetical protein